jgi:hypothetical protein
MKPAFNDSLAAVNSAAELGNLFRESDLDPCYAYMPARIKT